MAVLRKEKKSNFTVIDNAIFKDRGLSLKATGLLCLMLSLPDNWEYSVQGLSKLTTDGVSSITSGLKELTEAGYFRREQRYKDGKFAGYEYIISETKKCDFPFSENPLTENTITENHTQLNTNTLSTKELSSSYTDVWKALKPEEIDYFMTEYEEGSELIQAVYEDVKSKRKTVEKAFEYIIGYAKNKGWATK